jgi:hypothetical protein
MGRMKNALVLFVLLFSALAVGATLLHGLVTAVPTHGMPPPFHSKVTAPGEPSPSS